jgi:hypothetical protein
MPRRLGNETLARFEEVKVHRAPRDMRVVAQHVTGEGGQLTQQLCPYQPSTNDDMCGRRGWRACCAVSHALKSR